MYVILHFIRCVNSCQCACIISDPSPEYCGGQCTNGSIRLVDGSSAHEGRIEVCIRGYWGTVCANGFSNNEASVACKQFGLPQNSKKYIKKQYFTIYPT